MSKAPTSPANIQKIEKMFDSISDLISNLYGRWLDEQEYEDINDYGKVISKSLPKDFKLESMTKKPFGFKFSIGTDALYAIVLGRNSIAWKRIS